VARLVERFWLLEGFRELATIAPGAWQTHAGELAPLFVSPAGGGL
jgi:hypothetical protein